MTLTLITNKNTKKTLKLQLDQILLFREALVKRLQDLKVRVEKARITRGQAEKRISEKEIKEMRIEEVIQNIQRLSNILKAGEVTLYSVNTFMGLCGKVTE